MKESLLLPDERSTMRLNPNAIEIIKPTSHGAFGANLSEERVVLVNDRDEPIGIEGKTEAHVQGTLHRAFSVFVLNASGQLLIQRRALTKYHSRGLWSNTCCGHPRPGEIIEEASTRRLREEMGLVSELSELFYFTYHVNLEDGLIENEYDHVLVGWYEGVPRPDPAEVADWRWVDVPTLSMDLKDHPENYAYWFRISFDRFVQAISINYLTVMRSNPTSQR
jgi:isopentenyl-diphosphate delta-isomerase